MRRIPRSVGWPLLALWTYGVFYFLANRAIYYPSKFPEGLWELQARLGAEDVWLTAAGGVRLHAWWIPGPETRLATLYLHGNAGNITHRAGAGEQIVAAGSSLLLLDYRGYGKSQGRPTEKGLYADADAAYQYLIDSGRAPGQIVLYGESLGTAVAVDLAARRPCAGVILQAPFSSASDVAGRLLPLLGPLLVHSFDSRSKIGRLRAPLLFLHGDRDEVIDFDLGRKLFEAAPEPKFFWPVPGAGHNNVLQAAGPRFQQRLREFYQDVLALRAVCTREGFATNSGKLAALLSRGASRDLFDAHQLFTTSNLDRAKLRLAIRRLRGDQP